MLSANRFVWDEYLGIFSQKIFSPVVVVVVAFENFSSNFGKRKTTKKTFLRGYIFLLLKHFFWLNRQQWHDKGSGCGSVGRVVASNTRGPWFESSLLFLINIFNVYCWKAAENRPLKTRTWYTSPLSNLPLTIEKTLSKSPCCPF